VAPDPITVLDGVSLSRKLAKDDYEKKLKRLWGRLAALSEEAHQRGISAVFAFEGWDAAGKGGAIRRLTRAMDAAHYRVIPIAAPTDEELAHHYLWRFWRHLPRAGHVAIFDRSWYGRILVERVEGFATEDEWKRAYTEINDFEGQLAHRGVVLLKFWMHLSRDEQLRRFKAREKVPFKKYKITADDYRNRDRWNDYELAADEMIQRTSTDRARWHVVAANDKRSARIDVLKLVCRALSKAVKK
jgi:polyphosphate kinase 2 (PPK2 family)